MGFQQRLYFERADARIKFRRRPPSSAISFMEGECTVVAGLKQVKTAAYTSTTHKASTTLACLRVQVRRMMTHGLA